MLRSSEDVAGSLLARPVSPPVAIHPRPRVCPRPRLRTRGRTVASASLPRDTPRIASASWRKALTFIGPAFARFYRHVLTFGDIWCLFVSFGPAPHIYQRGERVGEPVCTIHGHYPESTWLSVRLAARYRGTCPHLVGPVGQRFVELLL